MSNDVFVFQVHTNESETCDYIVISETFENVRIAFESRFDELQKMGVELVSFEKPNYNEEDCEVAGFFKVENTDGTITVGKIYEYCVFN